MSIAGHFLGRPLLSRALLAVNLPAYAVLVALTAARIVIHPGRLAADLADHARGSGYFTIVAGTCVLGSQCLPIAGWRGPAEFLFAAGLGLWFFVMYAFFTAVLARGARPTLEQGIHGAWLIATGATQSVSVLALTPGDPFG
ncbi:MAG: hypothetical protein K8H90_05445 [Thermoanaerobaculia bacterium]|nr:hypothetical protein [Thermoanaerobaculia bacterium]